MANVKFIKIAKDSTKVFETYDDGAIYFDEKNKQIVLGQGTDTPSIQMKVSDATYVNNVLTITVAGKPITLDFSDVAFASEIEKRLKALEAVKPVAGHDVVIGKLDDDDTVADNAISVALSENITVAGLNDTYGCGLIKNGMTVPAGTTLTELLKMLLSKEVQPGAATKPTISITTASVASGLKEVNSSVNVGTATISKSAGHFNNNGWSSPAQPTAAFTWSGEKMSSSRTTGATGYVAQTNAASIAQGTATTADGTNTVTISASANYSAPTNKPITNLKNESSLVSATWTAATATASKQISWTGVYPIYTNGVNSSTTDVSAPTVTATPDAAKLPLVANGTTFGVAFAAMVVGGTGYRLLLRSGKKISSAKKLNGLTAKYDIDVTSSFVKNTTAITKQSGGVNETYYAWEYKGTDGANRVIFTVANE